MIELETTTPFFQDKQEVVDEILSRYPEEGRRSALMPLLWEVQRAERYISEARMHEIAEIVGITATEVKGVLSFYSTYHEQPEGKYHIQICSTLSCALAGANEMYDYLVNELGIVNGETDAEGASRSRRPSAWLLRHRARAARERHLLRAQEPLPAPHPGATAGRNA